MTPPPLPRTVRDDVLDGVMAGARVVSGVIAASLAEVEEAVTLPQLRVLVVAADLGALTMTDVADVLSVHASNATRQVERLVRSGLLDRRDDPQNRRHVRLTLTAAGQRLVETVLEHRREAFRHLLGTLPRATQVAVGEAMTRLAEAAGGRTDAQTWVVPMTGGRG